MGRCHARHLIHFPAKFLLRFRVDLEKGTTSQLTLRLRGLDAADFLQRDGELGEGGIG